MGEIRSNLSYDVLVFDRDVIFADGKVHSAHYLVCMLFFERSQSRDLGSPMLEV